MEHDGAMVGRRRRRAQVGAVSDRTRTRGHCGVGVHRCSAADADTAGGSFAVPAPHIDEPGQAGNSTETLVLAGGCFWGVQGVFQHVKGVTAAESGYAGGDARTANYETVSTGETGHAESVRIAYDPTQVTYGQLLQIFFSVALDPTQLNRQGPDHGTQYRSAIFAQDDTQRRVAESYIAQLNHDTVFPSPIVTTVSPKASSIRPSGTTRTS